MRAADLYEKAGSLDRTTVMLEQFVQLSAAGGGRHEARARCRSGSQVEQRHAPRLSKGSYQADAAAGAQPPTARSSPPPPSRLGRAGARAFRAVKLTAPLKSRWLRRSWLWKPPGRLQGGAGVQHFHDTTAATYEMAELYRTLGRDLLASGNPRI
jgi:hypothetical protein